jgi:hypothetical protein
MQITVSYAWLVLTSVVQTQTPHVNCEQVKYEHKSSL